MKGLGTTLFDFLGWCRRRASERTCRTYTNYLIRPLNPSNELSRLAWNVYYKNTLGRDDLLGLIKTRQSDVDIYVPPGSELKKSLEATCRDSSELCKAYKLLVYTGLG